MAEQKSKLLTTITLNNNGEEFDNKFILRSGLIVDPNEDRSDDNQNTIEGESEESFKMNVKNFKNSQEFNDYLNNKEERKKYNNNMQMKINSSKMFKEDEENPSPTRQLRAGSFASFQGFMDDTDSAANNSLYGDIAYIENPRDKLKMTPEDRKGFEPRYQAKLS